MLLAGQFLWFTVCVFCNLIGGAIYVDGFHGRKLEFENFEHKFEVSTSISFCILLIRVIIRVCHIHYTCACIVQL